MIPNKTIEKKEAEDEENIQDRRKISDETIKHIEYALEGIDDPNVAEAIRELAHLTTGDDRFEK